MVGGRKCHLKKFEVIFQCKDLVSAECMPKYMCNKFSSVLIIWKPAHTDHWAVGQRSLIHPMKTKVSARERNRGKENKVVHQWKKLRIRAYGPISPQRQSV